MRLASAEFEGFVTGFRTRMTKEGRAGTVTIEFDATEQIASDLTELLGSACSINLEALQSSFLPAALGVEPRVDRETGEVLEPAGAATGAATP